jgi:A/G-specific adenine glycosylase
MENYNFAQALLAWYDQNARDLPWRRQSDPYAIWLSEVMLQQTQVNTVIPYYNRFLARYPTLDRLAAAKEDEVLKLWEGLGYYRRARLFLQGVREVSAKYGGRIPDDYKTLSTLPGVGSYMAGALSSIAYNHPAPAVDGNVIRVITRVLACGEDATLPKTRRMIEVWVMHHIPKERAGDFNQALMELGATLCRVKGPRCPECPVQKDCRGSQLNPELFPVKKPVKRVPVEHRAVYVVSNEGRLCLRQRTESLLHHLWEYPNTLIENVREEDHAWAAEFFGRDLVYVYKGKASQIFTHLRWEMRIYTGVWPQGVPTPNREGLGWFLPSEIEKLTKAGFVKRVDRVRGTDPPLALP